MKKHQNSHIRSIIFSFGITLVLIVLGKPSQVDRLKTYLAKGKVFNHELV